MDIMNLIHEICLTKIKINEIPKWNFMKKIVYTKKFNKLITEFTKLDIFDMAGHTTAFLYSLPKHATAKLSDSNIAFDYWFLQICIIGDTEYDITTVEYSTNNRFTVNNINIDYTIHRNMRISKFINSKWEPVVVKLKQKYLEIILEMAEFIAKREDNYE